MNINISKIEELSETGIPMGDNCELCQTELKPIFHLEAPHFGLDIILCDKCIATFKQKVEKIQVNTSNTSNKTTDFEFKGYIYFRNSEIEEIESALDYFSSIEILSIEDRREDSDEIAANVSIILALSSDLNAEEVTKEMLNDISAVCVSHTSETRDSIDIDNYLIQQI